MNLGALAGWLRQIAAPAADPAACHVRSVSRTHVGRVRAINEDRVLDMSEHRLWAIADGMGGHAAGDAAAEAAIAALQNAALDGQVSADSIGAALSEVNRRLRERTRQGSPMSGATIVAMFEKNRAVTILWAGDCRAYRLRDGRLAQLTHDHTIVQELVDSGALDAVQAATHPQANVVTRALGAAEDLRLDRATSDALAGDLFLLCSDGLITAPIALDKLMQATPRSLTWNAESLIAEALSAGGKDNISLLLIEIV
ncbi:serine/threonine-protein phosphatase [Sphingomonas sp. CGMCC 1.13654]|uniref:Serine/threonine-protein phosphatase n=1 Tax=Sphingomonas chungangi TaxID=2683589 RepID=A0A838L734_9SPHN|nr:protein phosphatase 2C domain-containing protein [Sphingomonas chungangi]MBA2935131.1 serine/threonine-protein phosphatase [Sphingomonas chungangi]MVW56077.1 SpoIIE family protein phosphatase [Sphingomonas chungangi]